MDLPHRSLPEQGIDANHVLEDLRAAKANDRDWAGGKVFSLVYDGGEELHELHGEALKLYSAENGLNVLAFPSIGQLSHDLVRITAELLGAGAPGAPEGVAGHLTSGGTESLLWAMKVARDEGYARGIERPKVVASTSTHITLTKAVDYFGVEVQRVPVDPSTFRADVDAIAAACDERTVMVVGSAPSYPQGVIDDITSLAALAQERGILCHVDACLGGWLLPFLGELGHVDTPWDFRVSGVTSISADLHKYGYASKGVSAILYASPELARRQIFASDDWLGGFYASTTVAGSKPAGPIAAAWATAMHLGRDGYLALAEQTWQAARELIDGVQANPALRTWGDPDMTVAAIGSADANLDVFALGDYLSARGWYLDRQANPDALHATVHAGSAKGVGGLLADLGTGVEEVLGQRATDRSTTYGADEA